MSPTKANTILPLIYMYVHIYEGKLIYMYVHIYEGKLIYVCIDVDDWYFCNLASYIYIYMYIRICIQVNSCMYI